MMTNLTGREIQDVIKSNARRSPENLRTALEMKYAAFELEKEIKIAFALKLEKELKKRFEKRGYQIVNQIDERFECFAGFTLWKKSWLELSGGETQAPCYVVEAQRKDMRELIYGIGRPSENADILNGLNLTDILPRKSATWYCYDYFQNQYRSWDTPEILANMAMETGIVKGEPSCPVAEAYINVMSDLMEKTEERIDEIMLGNRGGA